MIKGIGTDIIEISRIESGMRRTSSFIDKLFSDEEKYLLELRGFKSETVAGRFAAKEAVSKALGTGFRGFELRDIQILSDEKGKPIAKLCNGALDRLQEIGGEQVYVSISHCQSYATAYVVIE